jgi:hypothetical protein
MFSPFSLLSVKLNLSLQLYDPIRGSTKLMRQLLLPLQCTLAICFSDTSALMQQLQYGLSGSIKLIAVV